MPPQTVPLALWDLVNDKVKYALETYTETLSLSADPAFLRQGAFAFGALSLLFDVLNAPFSEEETARILATQEVRFGQPQMWRAVARAERDVARHYSERLDLQTLSVFPAFHSLHELVRSELSLWGKGPERLLLADHQSFLIVGAGPLPLTALLMRKAVSYPIVCLESAPEDARRAQAFLDKGHISHDEIRIVCADPLSFDYGAHPAILLEAGQPRKKDILAAIRRDDALHQIAIRSGIGINTLLYEPLEDQLGASLYLDFDRRTVAVPGVHKTTYFSALPAEVLIFEKEEPKPDWGDVKFIPLPAHSNG